MEAELRRLRKEKDDLSLDQREERKIFLGKNEITVCFLDRWPKTKCRVTFDTSFCYQFFMLFHKVPSVLLSMVALITTYFKESEESVEEFPPIRKLFKKLPWRTKPRVLRERE